MGNIGELTRGPPGPAGPQGPPGEPGLDGVKVSLRFLVYSKDQNTPVISMSAPDS